MRTSKTVACAHSNIALIKYWGKRDSDLNLPAVSSLSLTLDTLLTTTTVELMPDQGRLEFSLNGASATAAQCAKVGALASIFQRRTTHQGRLKITSDNNFPTAAGLASSASGFAALVKGLDQVYQSEFTDSELSALARIGSGSAARSLFGGFVIMDKGQLQDGSDAVATQLADKTHWPLAVVIAITSEVAKSTSSTVGMEATRESSPFYAAWLEHQEQDISDAREAINTKDFERLATLSEYSCLKMHGLMMSAQPGLLYWNPTTLACIHEVRRLRQSGVEVFFTVDAGPQVKAICEPSFAQEVAASLQLIDGVHRVVTTGLGDGAWCESI